MKICSDPIQMRNKSNDIRTVSSELQNIMGQIETLVLSVNGQWQGDAERAYASRILFVKKEFSHIMSFFEDYSSLLELFADEYDEFDTSLASKISLT